VEKKKTENKGPLLKGVVEEGGEGIEKEEREQNNEKERSTRFRSRILERDGRVPSSSAPGKRNLKKENPLGVSARKRRGGIREGGTPTRERGRPANREKGGELGTITGAEKNSESYGTRFYKELSFKLCKWRRRDKAVLGKAGGAWRVLLSGVLRGGDRH